MNLSTNPFFTHGIDKLCTICHLILKDTESTHSIFSTFDELESPMNVLQVLQSFSNFNFYNCPQMVCPTCYEKIIDVYKFIQMCNKASESMQHYLTNVEPFNTIKDETIVDVKIEESIAPTRIMIDGQNFLEEIENEKISKFDELGMVISGTEIKIEERILKEEMETEETSNNEEITISHTEIVTEDPLKDHETDVLCLECQEVFNNDKQLEIHMRSHKKQFLCNDCGKVFTTKSGLKTHIHYSVVHFKENDGLNISVVPNVWIIKEGLGEDECFKCWWPLLEARKHIRKRTPPNPKWNIYDLHAVLGYYDTYETALYHEKRIIESQTESEQDNGDDQKKRNRMVRMGKRKMESFDTEDTSETEHEDDDVPLHNANSSYSKGFYFDNNISSERHKLIVEELRSDSPLTRVSLADDDEVETLLNKRKKINNAANKQANGDIPFAILPLAESSNNANASVSKSSTNVICNDANSASGQESASLVLVSESTLNLVLKELIALKQLVNIVNEKLTDNGTSSYKSTIHLPKLPFLDYDELIKYSNCLESDTEACNQLLYNLKVIGGNDAKDHTKRSLSHLFTNELALKCSWTGQKNHIPLRGLNIMKIIIDAVIGQNNTTIKDVEGYIMDWFRYTNQRIQRKNN